MKFPDTTNGDRAFGRTARALLIVVPVLVALAAGSVKGYAWLEARVDERVAAATEAPLAAIRESLVDIAREQLRHAAQLTRIETIIDLERDRHDARDRR